MSRSKTTFWEDVQWWSMGLGNYTHLKNIEARGSDGTVVAKAPVLLNNGYINLTCKYPLALVQVMMCPVWFCTEYTYAIYVNSRFLKFFTPMEQRAIFMHELGHIYHGHMKTKSEELKFEHELEADAFACRFGAGPLLRQVLEKCCQEMHSVCKTQEELASWINPMRERIDHIHRQEVN